jgi:hypothetical protein
MIRNALSSTLFFSTTVQLVTIFETAAYFLVGSFHFGRNLARFFCFNFLFYAILFAETVLLASKIPEEMENIIMSAKQLHADLVFREISLNDDVLYSRLQVIISEKPVRLTIGGFVDIRKSLILAAFGSLLTYGVLVMQFAKK